MTDHNELLTFEAGGHRYSLHGRCSHCQRTVDNYDDLHRVTSIADGGHGVECVLRGDIKIHEAAPLASIEDAPREPAGDGTPTEDR